MGETPPVRIQLRRTKGRLPAGAIVVARPSRWGNPYVVGSDSARSRRGILGPAAGYYNRSDVLLELANESWPTPRHGGAEGRP